MIRATAVALMLMAGPVAAFDTTDRAAVKRKAAEVEHLIKTEGFGAFVMQMPPPLEQAMAEHLGESVAQMRHEMGKRAGALDMAEFQLNLAMMSTGDTASGRPYALVPARGTLPFDAGGGLAMVFTLLFFEDEGTWHAVSTPQQADAEMVARAYPDLEGLTVPETQLAPMPRP